MRIVRSARKRENPNRKKKLWVNQFGQGQKYSWIQAKNWIAHNKSDKEKSAL